MAIGTGSEGTPRRRIAWALLGLGALAVTIVVAILAWPRGETLPVVPASSVVPSTIVPTTVIAPTTTATIPEPSTVIAPATTALTPDPTVVADAQDDHHGHGHRPVRPAPAASTPTAATDPTPPAPPETSAPAPGHLVLDASPYAIVTLEGRRLGITPIEVDLPAGAHVLTLRNPEQGIETTYRVTIRSGETVRRTVALE